MKHNKVLNRPMFNSQNSAYGRGITANLVSEEQRVKYNTGGRVRLAEGTGYQLGETPIGKAGKTFVHRGIYDPIVAGYDMFGAVPLNTAARMFGYNPGFSGTKFMDTLTGGAYSKYGNLDPDVAHFPPFLKTSAKEGWAHKKKEDAELKKEKIEAIEVADDSGIKKVDPISDTLDWTPQEKKEKMGQIQLKLAQRLVGGARDKWGSKAQMKNIGDAFGDVAAIGDKTELRKEERKYQAWAKAKKDIARDVQASTLEYNNLRAAGVGEAKALDISTGGKIKAKTIPSSTNKKQRKKAVEATQKGDIIYDEDIQSFTLSGYIDEETGRSIPVPREKLVEVQEIFLKQGA